MSDALPVRAPLATAVARATIDCKCGGAMLKKTSEIRMPDVYLKCDKCGVVIDMTPEQYHGHAPRPSWAE